MMPLPSRNYETLDAIAVIASLVIVAGIILGLFVQPLDPAVAPIVSSLATAILGVPISYGAFRWGNTVGAKAATEAAAKVSERSADALAQLAGAGPAPPSAPMADEPMPDAAAIRP
jgi:hypothetical protein